MTERIKQLFQQQFDGTPILIASPGRINLIGEHTDYNDGFVLPAAIDRRIYMAMATNGTSTKCRLSAADLKETFEIDLGNLERLDSPGWVNYILGVAAELQKEGLQLAGFDAVFAGNIPIGGGLSSSAALENAVGVGCNHLFELNQDNTALLHISQKAEHHYAGVKCGIMDQFATMMGKAGQALLLDCRSLDFEYVPLDLGQYTLVLCDTQVSHSLAASEYNTRREECEMAVRLLKPAFPGIESLRDITPAALEAERDRLSPLIFRRAKHVIEENERVHLAVAALQRGNLQHLGSLLYQSHESLQHDYEVSCPELDFLVDQTRRLDWVLGARMMGGGFGGSTLNIVQSAHADEFVRDLAATYHREMGKEMNHYIVKTVDGTSIVSNMEEDQ